jgi:hypothetical protein
LLTGPFETTHMGTAIAVQQRIRPGNDLQLRVEEACDLGAVDRL